MLTSQIFALRSGGTIKSINLVYQAIGRQLNSQLRLWQLSTLWLDIRADMKTAL